MGLPGSEEASGRSHDVLRSLLKRQPQFFMLAIELLEIEIGGGIGCLSLHTYM